MSGVHPRSIGAVLTLGLVLGACSGAQPVRSEAPTLAPTVAASAVATEPAPTPTAASTISSTATPDPTAAPDPTATPAPTGPQPLRMGTLPAGEYQTNLFEPQLVFALPEGWSQFFPDEDDEMYMGSSDAELAISVADEVVDPESRSPVEAPEDLSAWIAAHPSFGSPEPVEIQIGGVDSRYLDLAGPSADTKLLHFPGGDFHIPPGVATRIYVVPLDGHDLSLIVMPPQGGSIEEAIDATQSIIDSLAIEGAP